LIIDDDDFQSAFVTSVLERIGGIRIFSANNADDACRLAQQHKPDFVLLDIYMPQVDGWALLDKLRRIHPGVLAIMVTGSHLPADFKRSMGRRVDGFCIKPVLPDVMLKALRNARLRQCAPQ
jgi:DNA-binding NarL/FixJ family response regulator